MASLIASTVAATAKVQSRVNKYEKGSSFVIEPHGNTDSKRQVINRGPKNLALLFEKDADGDFVLVNALKFLEESDPAAFAAAKANIAGLIRQLRTV